MFDYIKGFVAFISPQYVVVDHEGIGYQIHTPNPYSFQKNDEKIQVFIYQYVREDTNALYGFKTCQEREMFMKLINVSGIGPKGALAILAGGQTEHVVEAIEQENEAFLIKFPGVGKKTARQMILDLKGKLSEVVETYNLLSETAPGELPNMKDLEDAVEALQALGYAEREIKKITPMLEKETLTTEGYIKKALQLLLLKK